MSPCFSHRSHRSNIPNDRLPVNSGRAGRGDCPTLPFVGSHARDRVLVYSKRLGFSLKAPTPIIGAREDPGIRILGRVKGYTVQPPGSNQAKSGRSESRFRRGRFVETSDEPLSTLVSRQDKRLATMTSSDDGVFGGLDEGGRRKCAHPDGTSCRSKPRIYDADGAVVTFGSVANMGCMEMNKTGSPTDTRTFPRGEKETVCTQPPAS